MLKTRAKNGTVHFEAHITSHSIEHGFEIPLSGMRMTRDDKMDTILRECIRKIQRMRLKFLLYLVDGGFFSVACILILQSMGRYYLIIILSRRLFLKRRNRLHCQHHLTVVFYSKLQKSIFCPFQIQQPIIRQGDLK